MDNLSNRRVRKDGREGNIFNEVEIGVRWDNGSMYKVKLKDLEFIDEKTKIKLKYVADSKYPPIGDCKKLTEDDKNDIEELEIL